MKDLFVIRNNSYIKHQIRHSWKRRLINGIFWCFKICPQILDTPFKRWCLVLLPLSVDCPCRLESNEKKKQKLQHVMGRLGHKRNSGFLLLSLWAADCGTAGCHAGRTLRKCYAEVRSIQNWSLQPTATGVSSGTKGCNLTPDNKRQEYPTLPRSPVT